MSGTAARGTAPLLEARGLGYAVGAKTILDGVSFDVRPGELVGVIGPNGAGKTTLLRLVCGLLPPTSGGVSLSGVPLSGLGFRKRALLVSFMSQEISQELGFRVMSVLLMGRYPYIARFQRESAADVELSRRMLSYVGLSGFEDRPFGELSGGERQLVLFAKTLIQDTGLVLLDEPGSHLDIRHEDTIFSMAQELAREGKAVVASVHNLNVASHYCGRVLLLAEGRLVAAGSPEEVLDPEILDPVYGVKTTVSRSTATGSLTVSVIPFRARAGGARVHLIGGAGSAVNLTRELYRLGFSLTGGIAHTLDSDEAIWKSLGIPCASVGAFSRISEEDVERAAPLVCGAEIVVLCSFPVGSGNIGNLRLARKAARLIVLEPGRAEVQRSFFAEEGRALFEELCRSAILKSHSEIIEMLRQEAGGLKGGAVP